jgi:cell division protein FtsN
MADRKKTKRRKTSLKTRRSAPRRTRPAKKQPMPGWVWMLFGLAIGLSVAGTIYIQDRQLRTNATAPKSPIPATVKSKSQQPAPKAKPEPRFKFYEMLPNFEVVIPEEEEFARPDVQQRPIDSPGIYVLQAGSFSNYADADRVKAQLALLGIVSRIQKISIEDKVYHRVRIGPVEELERLNGLRQQLRQARVEAMVIRVGE